MKGVIAADLFLVLAMMGCLYLLWLHDEEIKELLQSHDRLRLAVGDLAANQPKPRAPRAPKPTENGKAD